LIKQAIAVLIISTVLALGVNLVSPNAIPYIGEYRELHSGDGPVLPPSAEPGDPPYIAIDVAQFEFDHEEVIFVDARDPSEFECGTIPGSINMPFDYLPEGPLKPYFDSSLARAALDTRLITFCSGEECDLSLHLARNLQYEGYTNVAIFFGGAREWERFELEVERRAECGE